MQQSTTREKMLGVSAPQAPGWSHAEGGHGLQLDRRRGEQGGAAGGRRRDSGRKAKRRRHTANQKKRGGGGCNHRSKTPLAHHHISPAAARPEPVRRRRRGRAGLLVSAGRGQGQGRGRRTPEARVRARGEASAWGAPPSCCIFSLSLLLSFSLSRSLVCEQNSAQYFTGAHKGERHGRTAARRARGGGGAFPVSLATRVRGPPHW